MVANLVAGGHDVTVWSRSAVAAEALPAERVVVADSIAAAVAGAEFVMYALADDVAVNEVVLGARGIAASVDVTSIVIDLSTISPAASAAEADAFFRARRALSRCACFRFQGRGGQRRSVDRRWRE